MLSISQTKLNFMVKIFNFTVCEAIRSECRRERWEALIICNEKKPNQKLQVEKSQKEHHINKSAPSTGGRREPANQPHTQTSSLFCQLHNLLIKIFEANW